MKDKKVKKKKGPVWGWYNGSKEDLLHTKGCRKANMVEILCTHYENGTIRPVETTLRRV
jgi:hypothetical protein